MFTTPFHWTSKTVTTTLSTETVETDFYNLKNKTEGARRYGYRNDIVRFDNGEGDIGYRFELQTTLNGHRYQSSKYGQFFATEEEARAALAKSVTGALKRYAKLATNPANKITRDPRAFV